MTKRKAIRITGELSKAKLEALKKVREQIALELPELIHRHDLMTKAKQEPTLSGELRRAIHTSDFTVAILAERAGIQPMELNEFLTGERTLSSDVMDSLSNMLGYHLAKTAS